MLQPLCTLLLALPHYVDTTIIMQNRLACHGVDLPGPNAYNQKIEMPGNIS